MPENMQQIPLFDDIELGLPPDDKQLRTVGEQADITYIEGRARTALNDPAATGMSYWSINPYVGCAFGCAYCYARYAHRYKMQRAVDAGAVTDGLPPWLAFERRIFVKKNLASVLRNSLRHGGPKHRGLIEGEWVVIGTATDPYQPAERRYRLTRGVLEVLAEHEKMRVAIITKSPLVTRDADLLARVARSGRVTVHISLITLDRELARRIEPRAPTPEARVRAVERLRAAGVDVGINLMPVLPGITDQTASLDALIARVAQAGATHVNSGTLRLRSDARRRYLPFIETEFPELAARYRSAFATDHEMGDRYRAGLRQVVGRLCAAHGVPFGSRGDTPDDEEETVESPQLELTV
jgi:DNA repair photolyase